MSRYMPSTIEIDLMLFLYQNKGYHLPTPTARKLGLEPPTVRRMFGTLLKMDFVMAKPCENKGNCYRTTPKMFESFLRQKRKEIKRFKRVHLR